jgi:hypothetical protein
MIDSSSYDREEDSYIFSRYGSIWGWATWRRAWAHYDAELSDWVYMRRRHPFRSVFKTWSERRFVFELGNNLHKRKLDTWDYQWELIRFYHSGLSIVPCINLVVNIGFGPGATHTLRSDPSSAPPLKADLWSPIKHPRYLVVNEYHDLLYRNRVFLDPYSLRERAKRTIKKVAKLWLRSLRRFANARS